MLLLISFLWLHQVLPDLLLWKLLFIHLDFCNFVKFSHAHPLSLLPSKPKSPSLSSISLYSKSFLYLTILLALLCSFTNSNISFLRWGDQNCIQHSEWEHRKVLHSRKIMPSVLPLQYPFSECLTFCWPFFFFCYCCTLNWGFKEAANDSKITFLNCNCQLLIQHHVILVWVILS